MIRLLLHLLGRDDFEECKSCETLKQQIEFERAEKKELLATILNIVKPVVHEAPVQNIAPIVQTGGTFARRRAALEARDREAARVLRDSSNFGRPDGVKVSDVKQAQAHVSQDQSIDNLESELGINSEAEKSGEIK